MTVKNVPQKTYILIDDDPLVRKLWEMSAHKNGVNARLYAKPEDFFASEPSFERDTPIYIDAHLANGVDGYQVAAQVIVLGFTSVWIATGGSHFAPPKEAQTGLAGIVGKDPPWRKR